MATPYTTIDAVKLELQRMADSSDYDNENDLLESDVARATRMIDDHTRRTFAVTEATTRYIDCVEPYVVGPFLTFPKDIWKITAVVNGDGTAVDMDEISPQPRNFTRADGTIYISSAQSDAFPFWQIVFKHSSGKYWTFNNSPEEAIAVTGMWGFSSTPPEAIEWATTALAVHLYRMRHAVDESGFVASREGELLVPPSIPSYIQERIQYYVKVL